MQEEVVEGGGDGARDRGGEEVGLSLVQDVVGVELRQRLEWLKRKKRVENGQSPVVNFVVSLIKR